MPDPVWNTSGRSELDTELRADLLADENAELLATLRRALGFLDAAFETRYARPSSVQVAYAARLLRTALDRYPPPDPDAPLRRPPPPLTRTEIATTLHAAACGCADWFPGDPEDTQYDDMATALVQKGPVHP